MVNNYPKAYHDIIMQQLYDDDDSKYVLGSPTNDRYITSSKKNCNIYRLLLNDLDGKNSIDTLAKRWGKDVEETKKIVNLFFDKGLLEGSSSDNNISEVKKLSIKLCSIECKHLRKVSSKIADVILKVSFILMLVLMIVNVYFILNHGLDGVNILQYNGSYIKGLILSSLIMIPSFLLHELYHSLVALKYGLKPSKIDICLYMIFFPLFYVKIKGMYTISSKKRIRILCGGFFANLILANISLILYFITTNNIFLAMFLAQINIIFVNCNPFNLTDGYFIGTQLIKTVNLRPKLFGLLANFKRYIGKANKILIIYAIINFIIIFFNVVYFSSYSVNIISELLRFDVTSKYIIIINIISLLLYYLIIIIKYREKN